jgi:hypothetical protein
MRPPMRIPPSTSTAGGLLRATRTSRPLLGSAIGADWSERPVATLDADPSSRTRHP